VIYLDSVYDKILHDSWVVIERPISPGCMNDLPDPKEPLANGIVRLVRQVKGVNDAASPNYGTSSTVTQLTLDNPWLCDSDLLITVLRGTTVYAQSEPLDLAEDPIEDPVCKNGLELDRLYDGLQAGRWLIISGERTDIPGTSGVIASEVAMLAGVRQGLFQVDAATDSSSSTTTKMDLPRDKYHTFLDLASDLSYCYKRDTVSIYGNVAKATHGETFNEILGSGDASKSGQSFTLHQLPLTFTSAPTPSGIESTLKVSLDDIFWHEFDSFAGLGPTDHGYVTLRDDDDVTTVIFGDGQHGARPHTGVENIRAVYRAGIGKLGNVGAGQISQIITRLAGMRSVINSMPATGGADREDRDQARHNVPLALMALDRLISIKDYADFARTFGGIGKASSAKQSDGRRQVVHVTIAGEDDIPIDSNSDLYQNLLKALRKFGDPDQAVQVDVRCLIMLIIGAKIKVLPDYQWSSIEPKVRAALLDTFSFENRDLGQDAQLSEAISAIQSVPGVAYVDVDVFGGIPEKDSSGNPLPPADIAARISTLVDNGPSSRVVASIANLDEGVIHPAQIAYFVPSIEETLQLTELK
jgi:predicted phage baseplate assembly protein